MKPTLYRQHDFCQQVLIVATDKDRHFLIPIECTIANASLRAYVVTSEEVTGVDNAP